MNIDKIFIEGLINRLDDISDSVIIQAKKCLLDYMGVMIGGRKYVKNVHPEFFESFENTLPYRVILNGFCAHALELDDGHRHGMIHLGASIISAILEVHKYKKITHKQLLNGIVMGYEAAVRCACAIQPGHKMRGYHVSGTCGVIGSAMGIAFAYGFNREQLKSTLACAVTSAAGILEIQEQASELKPYNVGRAAMDGVLAAQIGRIALSGPDDILGGKRGFLSTMTNTPNPKFLTDFSGKDFAINGIYQKIYAACRHCHPAIDAVLDLKNKVLFKTDEVEKLEVHTYKLAVGSHDHTDIRNISSAKLSTPYAVALALVRGNAGYADYNEDNLKDYWINDITQKVHVIEDEDFTKKSPAIRGARVTLHLRGGKVFEMSCLYPKGEPENPLTLQEQEDKFRGLAMYGGLSTDECDKVIKEFQKDSFELDKIMDIILK